MITPSILVVDDEPNNFDVIEAFLPSQRYTLHYASSGREAIASMDMFSPDLILLDVMMPDLDGIELCRQIKGMSKFHSVPIIMVTALQTKKQLALCLEAGADDFISKPVNSLELRARVNSMLRIKQQYNRIESLSKLQKDTINLLRNNLQELRGNIASTLPHELNTPLNGILEPLELLREGIDNMNIEQMRQLLNIAHESALRLEKLSEKFSVYLQLEQENNTGNNQETSSTKVLIEYMAKTQAQLFNRSKDLICEVEDVEVPVSVQYFNRLIEELMENAFKFSLPGTPVQIRGQCLDKMFHLWVEDQGWGMTSVEMGSIGAFMQFENLSDTQQGVGLGLKIAKKIVKIYGGRFLIDSTHQQRTRVHITLPLLGGLKEKLSPNKA